MGAGRGAPTCLRGDTQGPAGTSPATGSPSARGEIPAPQSGSPALHARPQTRPSHQAGQTGPSPAPRPLPGSMDALWAHADTQVLWPPAPPRSRTAGSEKQSQRPLGDGRAAAATAGEVQERTQKVTRGC